MNNIDSLIEEGLSSKRSEAQHLARKMSAKWNAGVTPDIREIDKLYKLTHVTVVPCTRLEDDGRCRGWLRKYGAAAGIISQEPFSCPFAGKAPTESSFDQCPGYSTVNLEVSDGKPQSLRR